MALEGMDCRLALSYVGFPPPDITWLFNGQQISASSDAVYDALVLGDEARLLIREARREHEGQYSCRLHNKLGTAEVSLRVEDRVFCDF